MGKKKSKAQCRPLTVYDHFSPRDGKEQIVPYIRLRGKWVEQAGFYTGQRIKVIVTYGALLIVSDED